MTWHDVDGIYHLCRKHHPGMGMAVVWTPVCDLRGHYDDGKRHKGDKWCRQCMAREANEQPGGSAQKGKQQ